MVCAPPWELMLAVDMTKQISLAGKAARYSGMTDKPFNRLKASIAPLIGHHPCAKIFVILTTA
jgi:hypothetical protein